MFPTLRNGDGILIKNFNVREIEPLDIVVYKNSIAQVCHRVFKTKDEFGRRLFYTKGDYNLCFEKVGEASILGKVIGIYRRGKFRTLRFEKTILYYIVISSFTLLKETFKWYWGKIYNFSSFRLFIKIIIPFDKSHLCLKLSEDNNEDDFAGFFNFFPFNLSEHQIELRFLAKYKKFTVGKIWVVKNRKTGRIFIYGPYVKLFYRARYIGRDLVIKTIDVLKNNLHQNCIYVSVQQCEKSLISFYASLGFTVENAVTRQKGLFMHKRL
ncbi:MAG: hypothetical protein AMJ95_02420 [Omnitrophica WOR_2 bacterium SM23_72]|nr:MAG: hypothetical protein AMJ95_02420 [Omnitrophica WOR_2 bacterium SM23_72]